MTDTFNEGDLIEATKGDTVIRGRLNYYTDKDLWVGDAMRMFEQLQDGTWTVTLIEKAAPAHKPWQQAQVGETWALEPGGAHYNVVRGGRHRFTRADVFGEVHDVPCADSRITSAVKLEPVADTAKKVLERVELILSAGGIHALPNAFSGLAKEFGIQS